MICLIERIQTAFQRKFNKLQKAQKDDSTKPGKSYMKKKNEKFIREIEFFFFFKKADRNLGADEYYK